ncbi:YceI family protein [Aureivirga sp. CE67]|uniref:YceI family protein n=1 Tax=Aureivirga sp. CE67 TaxID=1788983 RepID=UPI0018C92637|nr:YceI family protein [Aureivirga sp. CE67]
MDILKNKISVIVFGLITTITFGQKYITKNGVTNFKASVEAFEPVQAENKNTTVLYNEATDEIAALIFVKSFHFEIALMEEHFNENYMDSDKFPKAKFKGKIITENDAQFIIGDLIIKGKSQKVKTKIDFNKGNNVSIKGAFNVKPQDFDIKIPEIVRNKIAKEIKIDFDYVLKPKN